MSNLITAYIAGPVLGSGVQATNVHSAISLAHRLASCGIVPFVPHLYFAWQMQEDVRDEEFFMRQCEEWVKRCDVFVRLPGNSPGSDREEKLARLHNKPRVLLRDSAGAPEFVYNVHEKTAEVRPSMDTRALVNLVARMHFDAQGNGERGAVSTFSTFQHRCAAWLRAQPFAAQGQTPDAPALGIVEEISEIREAMMLAMETKAGKIARAVLKMQQGIRGTREEHVARLQGEIGDVIVYAAGFCDAAGISLYECVNNALAKVESRDWSRFPTDGTTK